MDNISADKNDTINSHKLPIDHLFGIDLKNPFTMSNINPPVLDRGNFCLRPERRIISRDQKTGGAYRDRTDDLKLAKLALSQLS